MTLARGLPAPAGAALAPSPSEEFRAALRTRLLAVAAVQGIGETAAAPRYLTTVRGVGVRLAPPEAADTASDPPGDG